MRVRLSLVAIAVGSSAIGCSGIANRSMDCEFPALAAGENAQLALSCVDAITYGGTDYFVGCWPVDDSRVGEVFLEDGGETRFTAARDVEGLPRSEVFVLEGGNLQECRGKRLIAVTDDFGRLDAGLLKVPVGAANEERLARKKAPWIVPGRNEVPHALKINAVLSPEGVTVTNHNAFAWRNCDQIQINDEVEEIWETGQYLERLEPSASHTWPLTAFGGDHHGLEDLSESSIDEIRGKPFIIMCKAPRGPAFGRDKL